jgi:propionyl-CoA carboxylase alpha chain
MPPNGNGIRIDSGIYEGGEVSMFYDPMIAKLCVHAEDRESAIIKMQYALGQTFIEGIAHNIGFLQAIYSHQRFIAGDISTKFIEEEYAEGFSGAEINSESSRILIAVAMHIFMSDAKRADLISGQLDGFDRKLGNRWVVSIDDEQYPVIVKDTEQGYHVRSSKARIDVSSEWMIGDRLFRGLVDGNPVSVIVQPYAGGYYLTLGGRTIVTSVRTPRVAELEQYLPRRHVNMYKPEILSPIAGNIVSVKVRVGDEIKVGQELIAVEAMKMENALCAEFPSIVKEIHIKPGQNVATGELLITLESKDD